MENSFIRKFTNGLMDWLAENSAAARFERSVFDGVLAVVTAGLATGNWGVATLVAFIMAVLSPLKMKVAESLAEKVENGEKDGDDA